jgi:iron complex transport system substrate-binding protein
MKRPIYQWFTSTLCARRIQLDQAVLNDYLTQGEVDPELHEQAISTLETGGRIELFILESPTLDENQKSMMIWTLFTATFQIFNQRLCLKYIAPQNTYTLLKDIAVAAQAWLIARGFDRVCLVNEEGEPLMTMLPKIFRDHEKHGIDCLNEILRGGIESIQSTNDHLIQSVVSLAPSNLDILIELGSDALLIACEDSSDLPKTLSHIERLGPDLNPDLERVSQLHPDLVLSALSVPGMERIVTRLHHLGINQLVLAPRSLADVMREINQVADLLNITEVGDQVVADLETQRQSLLQQISGDSLPIYLEWWPKPMFTPGRICFSNELIELAGGVNIFKDRSGSSIEISPQEVIDRAPQVCFISWCGAPVEKLNPENLRKRDGLESLNPLARKYVIPIDEAYTGRPGPYMLEASRQMALVIQKVKDQIKVLDKQQHKAHHE